MHSRVNIELEVLCEFSFDFRHTVQLFFSWKKYYQNIREIISVLPYIAVSPDPGNGSVTILLKIGSKFFTKILKGRTV